MGGGAGGNYNVLAGGMNKFMNSANTAAMPAFAEGARINSQNQTEGGRLTAQADELDQRGKENSLQYLAQMKPEMMPGWSEWQQNNYDQNEGFLPFLGKALLGGGLASLSGGLLGGVGGALGSAAGARLLGGNSPGGGFAAPQWQQQNQGYQPGSIFNAGIGGGW